MFPFFTQIWYVQVFSCSRGSLVIWDWHSKKDNKLGGVPLKFADSWRGSTCFSRGNCATLLLGCELSKIAVEIKINTCFFLTQLAWTFTIFSWTNFPFQPPFNLQHRKNLSASHVYLRVHMVKYLEIPDQRCLLAPFHSCSGCFGQCWGGRLQNCVAGKGASWHLTMGPKWVLLIWVERSYLCSGMGLQTKLWLRGIKKRWIGRVQTKLCRAIDLPCHWRTC